MIFHLSRLSVRAESLFERPQDVDVSLQSAEFLGPLQYRSWRKMSSIIQPGTFTLTESHTLTGSKLAHAKVHTFCA